MIKINMNEIIMAKIKFDAKFLTHCMWACYKQILAVSQEKIKIECLETLMILLDSWGIAGI
jgi:hypothetical protein